MNCRLECGSYSKSRRDNGRIELSRVNHAVIIDPHVLGNRPRVSGNQLDLGRKKK